MSWYTIGLFVHILGALGLFAAAGIAHLVLARLRRARSVAQARDLLAMADAAAKLEALAALALLGAGLYLAATAWGWRVAWIDLSLGALLAVVVLGSAIGGPRIAARARAAAAAPDGPVPAALAARLADPVLRALARLATALELGVVFLMVAKPGLTGALATLGIALALGLAAAAPPRGARRAPAGAPAGGESRNAPA